MLRIAGVTLPNKRIEVALTYIFGIGSSQSKKIVKTANVNADTRVNDLTEEEENRLRTIIDKSFKVEGALRQQVLLDIKRLKEIDSYRGDRHKRHLPVRGQRSKTNSRTAHGNVRKTAGSGRKKSADKT